MCMACALQIWNKPWLNVAVIQLTTFIPGRALRRTYFNIVEKPRCLNFPEATSPLDPRSLQHAWSAIYNKYEDHRLSQLTDDFTCSRMSLQHDMGSVQTVSMQRRYFVTLCTASLKDAGSGPAVDVYITLSGLPQIVQYVNIICLNMFKHMHTLYVFCMCACACVCARARAASCISSR
jgi:hypothetical protein